MSICQYCFGRMHYGEYERDHAAICAKRERVFDEWDWLELRDLQKAIMEAVKELRESND